MRFWDASALVPLCVPEAQTAFASRESEADAEMVVWWATRVECASAIARLRRDRKMLPDDEGRALARLQGLSERWQEIEPTEQVRSLATVLVRRHALRAADALQLGSALKWAGPDPTGRGFVTFDARLAAAAALEGFAVIGGA